MTRLLVTHKILLLFSFLLVATPPSPISCQEVVTGTDADGPLGVVVVGGGLALGAGVIAAAKLAPIIVPKLPLLLKPKLAPLALKLGKKLAPKLAPLALKLGDKVATKLGDKLGTKLLGDKLGPKLGDLLALKFGDKLGPKLGEKLATKFGDKLASKLGDLFIPKLGDKLTPKLGDKLGSKLGEKLGSKLGDLLSLKFGDKLGPKLGDLLALKFGGKPATKLGDKLALTLGDKLAQKLGDKLAPKLGDKLGHKLGDKLGHKLGDLLESKLGLDKDSKLIKALEKGSKILTSIKDTKKGFLTTIKDKKTKFVTAIKDKKKKLLKGGAIALVILKGLIVAKHMPLFLALHVGKKLIGKKLITKKGKRDVRAQEELQLVDAALELANQADSGYCIPKLLCYLESQPETSLSREAVTLRKSLGNLNKSDYLNTKTSHGVYGLATAVGATLGKRNIKTCDLVFKSCPSDYNVLLDLLNSTFTH